MGIREVFQTLEFRNNNQEVLEHGPYECTRRNAWLSSGYYFWEESIESANYWGDKCCGNSYIVTKGLCDINDENCFDLVGNVKHVKEFSTVVQKLIDGGHIKRNSTVGHVLKFMRDNLDFNYSACRAETSGAFGRPFFEKVVPIDSLFFDVARRTARLKLHLIVQLCIFNLEGVNFRDFKIVHEKP